MRCSVQLEILKIENAGRIVDFADAQDVFVQAKVDAKKSGKKGLPPVRTDTIYNAKSTVEWEEDENRELVIHWDDEYCERIVLEYWHETSFGTPNTLIGKGVLKKNSKGLVKVPLTAEDRPCGTLSLKVSEGPAIRPALQASQRLLYLFQLRDELVSSVWKVTDLPVFSRVKQFLKAYPQAGVVLGIGVLLAVAAFLITVFMVSIPLGFTAMVTFPLWIVPALFFAFISAPFWVPLFGISMAGLFSALSFVLGLALTSQPVRKKGCKLSSQAIKTPLGQKVIYEPSK